MSSNITGDAAAPSTTRPAASATSGPPTLSWWSGTIVAVIVGTTVGAATAAGQEWLWDGLGSLANSAGPWATAAFAVAMLARRTVVAAFWGVTVLAWCELGYVIATESRGGVSGLSTVRFWLIAAVLAGPPLGVGAALFRQSRWWFGASVGPAVLAGVLIGEPLYALTTIADTTNTVYWVVELLVGVAFLAYVIVRIARRDLRPRLSIPLSIGSTALVAAVVVVVARVA